MNDVVIFKITSIIFIWTFGFAGGILPHFIQKANTSVMSLLNCLSAGVFLAGGFLHLLADAVENPSLREWSTIDEGKYEFPYAEMFCTLGFLAVFFVEQVAHTMQDSSSYNKLSEDEDEDGSHLTTLVSDTADIELSGSKNRHHHSSSHGHSHGFPVQSNTTPIAIVLFIALSFHSIMEGLGLGAQTESAWGIFLAIVIHKGLAAFALGSSLLRASLSKAKFVMYMFLFSLMSILGIIVGWIIAAEADEDAASSGICLALASGTFIYVAVMEVIPQEFSNHRNSLSKSAALFLGYAIFGLLAKWT